MLRLESLNILYTSFVFKKRGSIGHDREKIRGLKQAIPFFHYDIVFKGGKTD